MSFRLAVVIVVICLRSIVGAPAHAQASGDREAVRRAVLDYVEGFYEGDTTKLVRSVRPEVQKYGFYMPRDSARYIGEAMPWAEFLAYARTIRERKTPAPTTAAKEVTVFDVSDQTASAKLTAWWGTDYLLLAKYDGQWMIRMVVWQSPPRNVPK